jgi:hypothetical protein
MAKTYRDVAIEQMILTIEAAILASLVRCQPRIALRWVPPAGRVLPALGSFRSWVFPLLGPSRPLGPQW